MGVSVVMDFVAAQVVPGQWTTCEVKLRNTGAVVDQLELDIVGDAASWARVEPPTVNLLPGEEHLAQIMFSPPRSWRVPHGPTTYALRVLSREDTEGSVIQEGEIEVAPFAELAGELVPRTSTGRRSGRHQLAVDNLGNFPETISVMATDVDIKLDFRIDPANLTLEPGTAAFVKLKVKPKRTFLRGPNQTIPFQISATNSEGAPIVLPGSMVQTSLMPPWFFKALALAAVGCLAFAVLWLTLFKPTIEATARQVARDNTLVLAKAIEDASAKADQAAGTASGAQTDAQSAKEEAQAAGKTVEKAQSQVAKIAETSGSPATTLDPGDATDFRITTNDPPGGGPTLSQGPAIPAKKILWISDLFLQNPNGDTGELRIQRGDDVLLVFGLQNFRDLDYHFIQPAQFDSKSPVVVSVNCKNPTDDCTPSAFFSGQQVDKKTKSG